MGGSSSGCRAQFRRVVLADVLFLSGVTACHGWQIKKIQEDHGKILA